MDRGKERSTYRLSARTRALIDKLAKKNDTTRTQVVEDAIKEKAKREKVEVDGEV